MKTNLDQSISIFDYLQQNDDMCFIEKSLLEIEPAKAYCVEVNPRHNALYVTKSGFIYKGDKALDALSDIEYIAKFTTNWLEENLIHKSSGIGKFLTWVKKYVIDMQWGRAVWASVAEAGSAKKWVVRVFASPVAYVAGTVRDLVKTVFSIGATAFTSIWKGITQNGFNKYKLDSKVMWNDLGRQVKLDVCFKDMDESDYLRRCQKNDILDKEWLSKEDHPRPHRKVSQDFLDIVKKKFWDQNMDKINAGRKVYETYEDFYKKQPKFMQKINDLEEQLSKSNSLQRKDKKTRDELIKQLRSFEKKENPKNLAKIHSEGAVNKEQMEKDAIEKQITAINAKIEQQDNAIEAYEEEKLRYKLMLEKIEDAKEESENAYLKYEKDEYKMFYPNIPSGEYRVYARMEKACDELGLGEVKGFSTNFSESLETSLTEYAKSLANSFVIISVFRPMLASALTLKDGSGNTIHSPVSGGTMRFKDNVDAEFKNVLDDLKEGIAAIKWDDYLDAILSKYSNTEYLESILPKVEEEYIKLRAVSIENDKSIPEAIKPSLINLEKGFAEIDDEINVWDDSEPQELNDFL